jgi:hypothetical protein
MTGQVLVRIPVGADLGITAGEAAPQRVTRAASCAVHPVAFLHVSVVAASGEH